MGYRFCSECGRPLSERPASEDDLSPPSATDIFAPTTPEPAADIFADVVETPEPSAEIASEPPDAGGTRDPAPPAPETAGEEKTAGEGRVPATSPPPPGGGTQVFVSAAVLDTGRLTRLLPDGEVETVDFEDEVVVGSEEGAMRVDDPYLSPRHARVRRAGRSFIIEDLESVNGTFVRIEEPYELEADDRIMLGSQLFEFRATPGPTLVHLDADAEPGDTYPLDGVETTIGRESGDLVFGDDPLMSGRHASVRVARSGGVETAVIRDQGSRNGVYVRIREPLELADGTHFTVGKQVVRFERRHASDPFKRVI